MVAEDCAVEAPEFPDCASGAIVRLTLPPAPPSALTLAIESPPVMLPIETLSRPPMLERKVASPALPELAVALSPPAPPSPPMAVLRTWLTAAPVLPDTATADELAPLLAELWEAPAAVASPVAPESPVLPVWVPWLLAGAAPCACVVAGGAVVVVVDAASAAVGARSRMAAAATLVAPARQAAPATRTLLLPLVMLISLPWSAFEQVPVRGYTSPHDTKWVAF